MARKPKVSSVPDRIRGAIAIVLMIASFTFANLTDDTQWQLSGLIAGLLFMCTVFYWMKDAEPTAY